MSCFSKLTEFKHALQEISIRVNKRKESAKPKSQFTRDTSTFKRKYRPHLPKMKVPITKVWTKTIWTQPENGLFPGMSYEITTSLVHQEHRSKGWCDKETFESWPLTTFSSSLRFITTPRLKSPWWANSNDIRELWLSWNSHVLRCCGIMGNLWDWYKTQIRFCFSPSLQSNLGYRRSETPPWYTHGNRIYQDRQTQMSP